MLLSGCDGCSSGIMSSSQQLLMEQISKVKRKTRIVFFVILITLILIELEHYLNIEFHRTVLVWFHEFCAILSVIAQ